MRRFLLVLLVVGLVFGLSLPGFVQEKVYKFGVLGKSVHPYSDVVRKGMEDAAAFYPDVEATFFVPPTEDIPRQISTIEAWIAAGYDGISIAPSDPAAVIPVVQEALSKGIPVMTQDTDSPESGRLLYLGTDNYTAGKIAGKTMCDVLAARGKTEAKVVILTGSLTAMNSLQRMEGFKDALAENCPGVKVVDTLCDYEDTAKALANAEQALTAHPDLDAFYGVYAFNGPAAAKAIKAAGKVEDIDIVCFDTTDEHLAFIEEGVIDATVGQRQYFMGYHSITILYMIAKYGGYPAGWEKVKMLFPKTPEGDTIIDTGVDVVTKENLGAYCKQMYDWGVASEFCPAHYPEQYPPG